MKRGFAPLGRPEPRHHDRELLCADPGQKVLVSRSAAQPSRYLAQYGIACYMTKSVVDTFEVVEIAAEMAEPFLW